MTSEEPPERPEPPQTASGADRALGEPLPPELRSALQDLGVDPDDPAQRRVASLSLQHGHRIESYSAPWPPPGMFSEYERSFPGIGQEIIGWIKGEQAHRHQLEAEAMRGNERRMDRGQRSGLVVATMGIAASAAVGLFGNPWVAGVIAVVTVGGPPAALALAKMLGRQRAPPPGPSDPPHEA